MKEHFIHFNARRVHVRPGNDDALREETPWYAELQPNSAGFHRPMFHVTRATTGAAEIKEKDTIWLFAQLYTPWGKLPPALDARIDVENIEERADGGFRYKAAKTARWFPCADASELLFQLQSKTSDDQLNPLIKDTNKPIGYYLRRPRNWPAQTSYMNGNRSWMLLQRILSV
jgi:hypothetical protein